MSKYRFREYDALGLRKKVPGDRLPSAHHVAKHKQKQKDLEIVFDAKDYREYATGFRKRKLQRRQDALKHNKERERLERNQERLEKRTKMKAELGLADDYGVQSSTDDDAGDDTAPQPQSVAVYQGEGGMTTTVTTTALRSSDDEPLAGSAGDSEEDEEQGHEDEEQAASGRREANRARNGRDSTGPSMRSKMVAGGKKLNAKQRGEGGGRQRSSKMIGSVMKGAKGGGKKLKR